MKAIVFDFDGLIIDTETVWYEAYKEALGFYHADLPLEEFAKCIGTHDTVLFDYFKSQLGEDTDCDEIESRASEIVDVKLRTVNARDGVKEYLEEAHRSGLKIGLATSSSRAWVTRLLNELRLIDYFEAIVTKDDVEKVKPAPDLYAKAVEKLRVQPSEALAFEDSLNGLNAAVAAGLKCVVVPNPVTEALAFEKHELKMASMGEKTLDEVIKTINTQTVR
ncbi:HAD family hydrolase [Mesobacillus subterraneus]|uniref:HAD family hydrolase n=1 Tax=Mesobacillus subterraneus TaxID=285983 RepID=UPI001FE899EE|nr:HAD family hydrolase [Mesobacillus subterraneus]